VKRFLLFGLLGPLLGMAFAVWVVLPLWDVLHGHAPVFHGFDLFAAFQLGFVPAACAAVFDWFMRGKKWRLIGTALVAVAVMLLMWAAAFRSWEDFVVGVIVTAVPAAICSWLSGNKQKG
jgi:hypothetical protein